MTGRDERGRFLPGNKPTGGVRFARLGEVGQHSQGLHSNFDRGKVDEILDLIADGKTIKAACAVVGVRSGTFKSWIARNHGQIETEYWTAMRARMIGELDETIELTDSVLGCQNTAQVFAAKNSSDARWRVLSRLLRQLHPEAHLDIQHHKTEVHIFLPGKETDEQYAERIRRQEMVSKGLIDLPGKLLEDRSGEDEDEA